MFACARLGDEDAHNQGVMKSFSSRETNSRNQNIHTDANSSNEEKEMVKDNVGYVTLKQFVWNIISMFFFTEKFWKGKLQTAKQVYFAYRY